MESYEIAPRESFSFSRPEELSDWLRRFVRFRQASELASKPEEIQSNKLIYYTMGDEADDVLIYFALSEQDQKKYERCTNPFRLSFR